MLMKWLQAREYQVLAAILLVAALHGLFYIMLVPPWQHYDEPTHFEYVWMVANKGELPTPGEYDWDFRADLVRSMLAHKFYWNLPKPDPDDLSVVPAGLTLPQLDDPPLYYLLASLPLQMLQDAPLDSQLVAARQISLLLLLVSLIAAWGTVREITAPDSLWRFLIPLTMALLPGFVDLMTAVNNDVGAVAVFSLFLWGCARLFQRGPSVLNVAWVLLAAVASFYTKSTAFVALPFAGVAMVLGFLRGPLRPLAWGLILGGGALGVLALMYWQEPANWYRASMQAAPVRAAHPAAPVGQHVLRLNTAAPDSPVWLPSLAQALPSDWAASLGNRTLTFGFWIWAQPNTLQGESFQIRSPEVNIDKETSFRQVTISGQPQFFAFSVTTGEAPSRIWVSIDPRLQNQPQAPLIFIDGLVLVEGEFPEVQAPQFDDPEGTEGTWGGVPFRNLLRNPSAERTWPAFRVAVDNFIARRLPNNVRPSMLLYSLFDLESSGGYYAFTAGNLLDTFWGKFGWNHVSLPRPQVAYPLLGLLSLVGFLGAVFYPYGRSRNLPVDALLFFALVLAAVWGAALARGVIFLFVENPFIPAARYAYPAIIPTLLLIVAGWFGLAGYLSNWTRIPAYFWYIVYLLAFIIFDAVSLWGIVRFYQSIPG